MRSKLCHLKANARHSYGMKQLPMTVELAKLINDAVGPDVDTSDFAVFEAIALNTNPLPGKDGTVFEKATVMPMTLRQMSDHIAAGNHLPLVSDHELMGEPKGRVFHSDLNYNSDKGELELRVLFYLDATESVTIAKLNAGSLDEVSVSFLSTEFLCSECGWDYFGEDSTYENVSLRTCANGHTIGTDGVHAQLVGLSKFVEISLVARGAASNPKIVGKSQSKLLPASSLRLAAKGIEIDRLICQASLGEKVVSIDTNKLMTDLMESTRSITTLTIEKSGLETKLAAVEPKLAAAEAEIVELNTRLTAAESAPNNEADYQVALSFLGELLTNLSVAVGEEAPAELPKTVADLKTAIEDRNVKLTAILPVGGVSGSANASDETKPALFASAFSNRNFGK